MSNYAHVSRDSALQHRIWLAALTAAALCFASISIADDIQTPIRRSTNIPAEDLGTALETLAKERNFQIVYASQQMDGRRSRGVSGELTPEEALRGLLSGTGLTFKLLDARTVTFIPAARAFDAKTTPASVTSQWTSSAAGGGAGHRNRMGFWRRLRLAQIARSTSASSHSKSHARADGSAAAGDGAGLEEIVVTATRRPRLLSTVPISARVFTGKSLEIVDAKQIEDIALMTPGVTFVRGNSGTTQIAIRGINSDSGASTTGVYIDDTPVQSRVIGFSSTTIFPNIFDLERVEILRGPQGTLFGAGSEGGTIRFITLQPSLTDYTDKAGGELAFTEDGDPTFEARAALGGPLIEHEVGFRASVSYRHDGGYTDRVGRFDGALLARDDDWQDSYNAHVALAVEPLAGLRITPSLYFQSIYFNDSQSYWEYLSDPGAGRFDNGAPVTAPFRATSVLPGLLVRYQSAYFTVTSNTSFYEQGNRNNRDLSALVPNDLGVEISPGHPVPGDPGYEDQDVFLTSQDAFTQEVRIQSNGNPSRFTWLAGVFYQHERQSSDQYVPDTPGSFDQLVEAALGKSTQQAFGMGLADGAYSYRSMIGTLDAQLAGFGEVNLTVASSLTLTLGLRVERAKFEFTNRSDGPFNGGLTVVNGDEIETPVTPKYGVSYQMNRNNLLYLTVSKGFRTGGANAAIPSRCDAELALLGYHSAPESYKSDSDWSYEVGSKNRLLDDHLQLQSSVFDVRWSGIQQQVTLGTGCGLNFVANLGRATSWGFDVQGEYQAGEHLTTGLAIGYDDAEFGQSILSPADPVTGLRPVLVRAGNSLGVNPWMMAADAQFSFIWAGRSASLRVDDQFSSRQWNPTPDEDPRNQTYAPGMVALPRTNLLSLRLGVWLNGSVELSLFGKNILDSHPILNRTQFESNRDLIYTDRTFRPRTIGISFKSIL